MLGIIIGIASVIVMVSISSGATQAIEAAINSLGTNQLMVRPGASFAGGRNRGAGSAKQFSEKVFANLLQKFDFIEAGSGSLNSNAPIVYGNTNWTTSVNGVHQGFLEVKDWGLAAGRNFSDREVRSGGKVALLGNTTASNLFGDPYNAIGARIRIKNVPFLVIGLLEERGQSSFGGDQDDIVYIPISTARLRIKGRANKTVPDEVGTISLKIVEDFDLVEAVDELDYYLMAVREISPGAEPDFSVTDMLAFIQTRTATLTTMGLLLASTAAIALFVGGIGIMNIMLVSVTERTREIGLRLALGARKWDIMTQFLIEAITLCVIGSLIGVLVAVIVSGIIAAVSNWPMLLSVPTIVLAIASAAFVGVFFGYYPARKASNLNPIDALRFE